MFEKIKLWYRAAQYKNKYDKGGIAYLNSVIKENNTVIDIGAHKAGYTYWMKKRLKNSGKIYTIEPQVKLYAYIKKLKSTLKWDNVTVENLALSDKEGKVKLFIPLHKPKEFSSPGATILGNIKQQVTGITEEVKTETLDSFCNRHKITPDFLKIDVEGHELKIFRGGIRTLRNCKPKILVEIESRHVGKQVLLETFKFMTELGYKGHFISGMERIPIESFSIEKHQNLLDMKNYCNNFTFEPFF